MTQADVIVSGWMGPALLAGGMLRPVMEARCGLLGGLLDAVGGVKGFGFRF